MNCEIISNQASVLSQQSLYEDDLSDDGGSGSMQMQSMQSEKAEKRIKARKTPRRKNFR